MKPGYSKISDYILQALCELSGGNPSSKVINFDALAASVEKRLRKADLEYLRRFGAGVDHAVARALAPLLDAGEAKWEPISRTIVVTDFGLLLLGAEALGERSLSARAVEAAVSR